MAIVGSNNVDESAEIVPVCRDYKGTPEDAKNYISS